MTKILAPIILGLGLVASSMATAAERTVTLAVKNMYCVACPITVRKSVEAVPGVSEVVVSFEKKTAMITYDDTKTDLKALIAATTNAGYPSEPKR